LGVREGAAARRMHVGNLFDLVGLLAMQWRSPSALRRAQERKLRRLVRHAAANVPFYRETFRTLKIDARDIRTVADLAALPPISKRELQAASLQERMARNIDTQDCRSQTTSGSTGVPLEVFLRRSDETILNLGWVRAFLSAGLKPWEKRAVFKPKKDITERPSWYEYLGLMRRLDISTWTSPDEWIAAIQRWQPDAIMGYVKVVQLFAQAVQEQRSEGISPRLVFTTSEILDEASRAFLSTVFRAPVVNIYASAEGGCMAWECARCGALHVATDTVVFEILRDGRPAAPGEEGEVVITNLHSYAMPFIRYRQGDLATLSRERPRCGRGLPLLEGIQGRQDDCITLRDGRSISYSPFYYSVQSVPGVRRWRVIQENLDTLRVEIEPTPLFDYTAEELITSNLRGIVGKEMVVEIVRLDALETDPRQKFRAVSSKVTRR
jgi:phenylacetate-CoA ligase